jgi:hypothetical protein
MKVRRFANVIAALGLCALAATSLRAQTEAVFEEPLPGIAIGAYAGIAGGSVDAGYAVDSRGLSDAAECGRYESGSAQGFVAGALGELPLSRIVGLYAGLQWTHRSVELAYPCVDPAGTRMPDGSVALATTEFRSTATYDLASLQLGVTFRPVTLPFVVALTPTLSMTSSTSYAAREVIVTPVEASFVSGGQERPIGSGDFGSGDLSASLNGALWYEARIAERLWLVPRIAGSLALSEEVSRGAIRASGFEATLGLLFRFPPPETTSTPIEAGQRPATIE